MVIGDNVEVEAVLRSLHGNLHWRFRNGKNGRGTFCFGDAQSSNFGSRWIFVAGEA